MLQLAGDRVVLLADAQFLRAISELSLRIGICLQLGDCGTICLRALTQLEIRVETKGLGSGAQALAEGLGHRIKQLLETAIELQPKHADAHIALASFHAEVIHKVGRLLAHAQGADAATALRLYRRALELDPGSAIARIEYANGLVMLDGDRHMAQAEALYAEAAQCRPLDAMQTLDVELAKAELDD